jgi:hypothetical protein
MKCSFLSLPGPTTYCVNYLPKCIMSCLETLPREPAVCIKGGTPVLVWLDWKLLLGFTNILDEWKQQKLNKLFNFKSISHPKFGHLGNARLRKKLPCPSYSLVYSIRVVTNFATLLVILLTIIDLVSPLQFSFSVFGFVQFKI